jgi:hypothetical protein
MMYMVGLEKWLKEVCAMALRRCPYGGKSLMGSDNDSHSWLLPPSGIALPRFLEETLALGCP